MSFTSPPKSVLGMKMLSMKIPTLPASVNMPRISVGIVSVIQWNKLDFPAHLQRVKIKFLKLMDFLLSLKYTFQLQLYKIQLRK